MNIKNAKAKLKKDTVKVKVMFESPMAGREEAKKSKKIEKVEFITHIIASVNGAMVYEVSTSPFISKNPLFKFQFKGAKKGDKIEFVATDNNGKQAKKSIKIK